MNDTVVTPPAGQPVVPPVVVAQGNQATIIEPTPPTPAVVDSAGNIPNEEERLFAGKYKTVEELEKAYASSQSEYSKLQAANATPTPAPIPVVVPEGDDRLDPEVMKQLQPYMDKFAQPLIEGAMQSENERSWDKLKVEYGDDIHGQVETYFETLSASEKATMNNPAGARVIAEMLKAQGKLKADQRGRASQPTGSPRSHQPQGSKLSREIILAMPAAEYQSRIVEIQNWYLANSTAG